jgi:hypothetical protein
MSLLRLRRTKKPDTEVEAARREVDLAVDKFIEILDKVEEQAAEAQEELDARRAG